MLFSQVFSSIFKEEKYPFKKVTSYPVLEVGAVTISISGCVRSKTDRPWRRRRREKNKSITGTVNLIIFDQAFFLFPPESLGFLANLFSVEIIFYNQWSNSFNTV